MRNTFDMTVEYHYLCIDNEQFLSYVTGSKGDEYRVEFDSRSGWHCDCKGFKYNKTCKHIDKADVERCGWNSFYDEGSAIDVPEDLEHPNGKACPVCGGQVISRGYGV